MTGARYFENFMRFEYFGTIISSSRRIL